MENCIRSLLIGGDEVEILIIDDGSSDRTAEIADRLEKEHPGIVRAIHQINKGHGGAVNTGIENASGLYFKVVDSDDKVRASAYRSILDVLRRFSAVEGGETAAAEEEEEREEPIDLLISNFVYNKEDQNRHKVMEYRKCLPQNRVFDWTEARHFPVGKYILMHSVIFRTQMLRESGLRLPEHYYFIGRDDQSVHESVMIKRLDQQARVNRNMIDYYTDPANADRIGREPILKQYMFNYLEIITTITSVLAIRSGKPEHLQIRDEIWDYLKEKDENLWKKMRRRPLGMAMNSRNKAAMKAVSGCYLVAQRLFNFN